MNIFSLVTQLQNWHEAHGGSVGEAFEDLRELFEHLQHGAAVTPVMMAAACDEARTESLAAKRPEFKAQLDDLLQSKTHIGALDIDSVMALISFIVGDLGPLLKEYGPQVVALLKKLFARKKALDAAAELG